MIHTSLSSRCEEGPNNEILAEFTRAVQCTSDRW